MLITFVYSLGPRTDKTCADPGIVVMGWGSKGVMGAGPTDSADKFFFLIFVVFTLFHRGSSMALDNNENYNFPRFQGVQLFQG